MCSAKMAVKLNDCVAQVETHEEKPNESKSKRARETKQIKVSCAHEHSSPESLSIPSEFIDC